MRKIKTATAAAATTVDSPALAAVATSPATTHIDPPKEDKKETKNTKQKNRPPVK